MKVRKIRLSIPGALAIIFLLGSVVGAQPSTYRALHGLNDPGYHRLNYQPLDQVYHVYVRLPEDYQHGEKYPTVYLLDGGVTFPMLAGYYRYLRLGEEVPPAIVVGISYGTKDWRQGNARSRDFTAKAAERDYWGGAGEFAAFLRGTLFPLVESQYPSDPQRRIVFGQSLGGQFVLYAAQEAPDLFWGHIASNPALHRNLPFFISAASGKKSQDKQGTSRLFVSSGAEDDPRFREPALEWMAHWKKRENPPWDLRMVTLEGQSHFSAAPEAFRQGLRWMWFENSPSEPSVSAATKKDQPSE